MKIALTFDVESDFGMERTDNNIDDSLPIILKVLREERIKSTFFVTGEILEKKSEKILDICKGHEIACHSYSHKEFNRLSKNEIDKQLFKAKKIFQEFGLSPIGFRAPRFYMNEKILSVVSRYFSYDSSLVPSFLSLRYFHPFMSRVPFKIKGLVEIPIGTINYLRIPVISSFYFLLGGNFLFLLRRFGVSNSSVVVFHSFDFFRYDKPKFLPSYKYNLYYSKCGLHRVSFLKKLISELKKNGVVFKTCEEIYRKFVSP